MPACEPDAQAGPLPYPVRLGRKPITIATMASIVTTRMAAASISTNFSVAKSPRWLAPCAKYAPRYNPICIKAVCWQLGSSSAKAPIWLR